MKMTFPCSSYTYIPRNSTKMIFLGPGSFCLQSLRPLTAWRACLVSAQGCLLRLSVTSLTFLGFGQKIKTPPYGPLRLENRSYGTLTDPSSDNVSCSGVHSRWDFDGYSRISRLQLAYMTFLHAVSQICRQAFNPESICSGDGDVEGLDACACREKVFRFIGDC